VRPLAVALVGGLVGGFVAGCAGFTGMPALTLGLANETDRPILLYVNDEWVGTFPAGTVRNDITTGPHGGAPWRIEARTDRGLVLVAAEVFESPAPGAGVGAAGATTCGDITIWAGDSRPDVTPPNLPGREAPCD
jgi:hypothetical protein